MLGTAVDDSTAGEKHHSLVNNTVGKPWQEKSVGEYFRFCLITSCTRYGQTFQLFFSVFRSSTREKINIDVWNRW